MGMFNAREPRKFRRISIYTDERKEKLEKLVNEVKREQGELPPISEDYTHDRFRGKFSQFTPRTQSFSEGGWGRNFKWPVVLIAIILLLMLWKFLLTGDPRF